MREAFQMRLLLEEEGFHRAYERLTKEGIAALKTLILEAMPAAGQESKISLVQRMSLNETFHLKLCGYSGDDLLTRFLGETLKLLCRGTAQFMLDTPLSPDTIHLQLVKSLENGQKEEALAFLKKDICSIQEKFKEEIS
jgi:DNA-binding GntR family transcriptional regulator